eukprot:198246-Pelagomonas_calceolata.AAC.2
MRGWLRNARVLVAAVLLLLVLQLLLNNRRAAADANVAPEEPSTVCCRVPGGWLCVVPGRLAGLGDLG